MVSNNDYTLAASHLFVRRAAGRTALEPISLTWRWGTLVNLSAPFIARPVATTLVTIGIALAGILAFFRLPVSALPQVDFPTISVQAQLPGASPETVATSVANPLERHLGKIALAKRFRPDPHRPAIRAGSRHRRGRARRSGGH